MKFFRDQLILQLSTVTVLASYGKKSFATELSLRNRGRQREKEKKKESRDVCCKGERNRERGGQMGEEEKNRERERVEEERTNGKRREGCLS